MFKPTGWVLLAGFWGLAAQSAADTLNLAVAANFAAPMKQLEQRFEAASGHDVQVSLGSTGKLYAQIQNGAPFEVLLSADKERPQALVDEGLALADSLRVYAVGQLLLWGADAALVDAQGEVLSSNKFKHLAIANPKTAPYGTAAQQVLEKRGLWAGLAEKIVRGENITQTHQFVATGNAELGFIALSQYTQESGGSFWKVPEDLYAPIEQAMVVLKKGKDKPVVKAWLAFLATPEARQLIESFGYKVP